MSASVLIWMISSFRWEILFKVILFFLKSSGMYGICCLYCLLSFYQSILSSQRRSVTSTSSGAENSVKAFFFHFAKIIIFSENLSFFCCLFLFFAPTIVVFAPMIVAFASMIVAFAPMIVAFAPMILLSYSSFECLSHTPYL